MSELEREIDRIASETQFSGVVRVDRGADVALVRAYGQADRAHEVANTVDTQFGIASGTKGFTALSVVSLVEAGVFAPGTTARSLLGTDLPLIDAAVTIEHLLGHRSGIGDYLDEDTDLDLSSYLLAVPAQQLADTESYLSVLDGQTAKFEPDEGFSYCNGGYVVLALLAERATATPFAELVQNHVCGPAGLRDTAFLRSDELPGRAAFGYLDADGLRTNVFHLPVRGSGDGGIYTTASDVHALWAAFFAGEIVPAGWVAEMTRPRSVSPESESRSYGLGFWLDPPSGSVILEGCDTGVSFRSVHHPGRAITHTVLSNTTDGAWPLSRYLMDSLAPGVA